MKKLIALFLALFFVSNVYSLSVNLNAHPAAIDLGETTVTFTGTISDGTGPYNYEWDFQNNGTTDQTISNSTNTTETTTYDYAADGPGNYTAKLTVTDLSNGTTTTSFEVIDVYDLQVNLIIIPASGEGNIPFTVDFTATATDGAPNYVFEWDWGDNSIETENSSGTSNMLHTYTTQKTFTVKVKVIDRRFKSVETTVQVTATVGGNVAPTAEANGPYLKQQGISFNLDSTGSKDNSSSLGPGGITNYAWSLETQAGDPQCTFDLTGTNIISGNGSPYRNPAVTCNDFGTAKTNLTVSDAQGATDSDSTTIKISPTQNTDKINIVKMWVEPEIVKTGTDLKVFVTIRNETNQVQTFDLNYQIKEDIADTNISAAPNLIEIELNGSSALPSPTVNPYSQIDFQITVFDASLSVLEGRKNYWVYARAETAGENNTTFNKRRALFNYSSNKSVQVPETNLIGVLSALFFSLIILKNNKR